MAALIRKTFRWLFLTFVAILLTPLVAGPIQNWLSSKNYNDVASGLIVQALEWLIAVQGNLAFQFAFVAIVSVAAGAWGHYLAAKRDSAVEDDHSTDFMMMRNAISNMLAGFWSGLVQRGRYNLHDLHVIDEQTKISLNALYARLKRIGIKTPATEGYDQPWQYNMMQIGYLELVIPYAKSGLIPEVKVEIEKYLERHRVAIKELGSEKRVPPELTAALRPPR
jgi:hypothetical protein